MRNVVWEGKATLSTSLSHNTILSSPQYVYTGFFTSLWPHKRKKYCAEKACR